VVRQGERSDTFFVVESGTFTAAVDGREVATLDPGASFGETTLLLDGVRTATIRARTPAVVWSLEGTHFVSALRCGDGRTLTAADGMVRADVQDAAPAPPEGS
jgi:CRP-like cAMP-binding protein